jgi:TRAP-type C4-dicarboxylate transport system permease small subunit
MRYPLKWKKFVDKLGLASGCITLGIAALSIMEAISRYFFHSPTSWSLSVCCYMLIFLAYLASPYAFQEGGHVAVDLLRNHIDRFDKTGKRIPRRVLAVIGYCMTIIFVVILLVSAWSLAKIAIQYGRLSIMTPEIPMWILYMPMMVGSVFMLITLVFMVLDCVAKDSDDKYL